MRLENKTAIITGRGLGIAQVIVFGMAWGDGKITVVGRTKSKLEEILKGSDQKGKMKSLSLQMFLIPWM